MSARIKALKKLFEVRRSVTGSLVKVDERGYHVMTDKGMQICQNVTATGFHEGDSVRVVEGAIVGGVIAESTLPTFRV
jgi:Fe2+ transport system protein FeoA